MTHQLTRLTTRSTETEAIDHVVQAHLEKTQEVLTGDPLPAACYLVVRMELTLEQLVVAARLLLLAQLQQVFRLLDAPTPVLSRRVCPTLDGALVREAPLAFEEQLEALAAALLALCRCISGHGKPFLDPTPLTRTTAVVRDRCDIFDADDLETRRLKRANSCLSPGTRTANEDLDLLQAVLHALLRTRLCRDLSRERRALARTLKARRPGALPRDHVTLFVGKRDQCVVERRLDMRLADGDVLAHPATLASFGSLRLGHSWSLL